MNNFYFRSIDCNEDKTWLRKALELITFSLSKTEIKFASTNPWKSYVVNHEVHGEHKKNLIYILISSFA